MPARTGQDYIKGLQEQPREVWLDGQRIADVTTHPALCHGVRSIAALYDMQHDAKLRDEMTYRSPTSGHPVGLSFIVPKSLDDVQRRGRMMLHWARASCGMMGRSPDFLNVNFAAWAAASDYFARNRPEFKTNIERYYEYIREHDLTLTHALINLQRQRSPLGGQHLSEDTALRVVRETDAGIIVKGSRVLATLGPISDEIAVYSPRLRKMSEGSSPYALNFSIPCGTPGVRFLCRESFDLGRSHFDHPLGSRFEEMDAVVFFDNVLVPWERVFLLGDVDLVNDTAVATHSHVHTAHQGAAKNIAKSELMLGVALLMAETLGSTQVPHVQERLAELMVHAEVMRASLRAAEVDATLDRWGVMCPAGLPLEVIRTLFMNVYPRMVEILQLMGSSSFMIIPSEADFQSALRPEIEQYLATDSASARERVKLFRLAWDMACSAFAGRQVLYERFFAGDPLNRAQFLYSIYPKEPLMERIREFLAQGEEA
ncbi:MAG TPA: 4-hydroxyphenylacetate 3-monooxygenase, oxygenase component [Candidatus Tectomicrobia bacterium]|nr:4-hydroxyphenylacetate 3-monooxygenase, oxygenase component [Candidatus Tectomicrobia bacterium]